MYDFHQNSYFTVVNILPTTHFVSLKVEQFCDEDGVYNSRVITGNVRQVRNHILTFPNDSKAIYQRSLTVQKSNLVSTEQEKKCRKRSVLSEEQIQL